MAATTIHNGEPPVQGNAFLPIPQFDSPEMVRILYNKPPTEAFVIIDQVQRNSRSRDSTQSSSLQLDQYTTQHLDSASLYEPQPLPHNIDGQSSNPASSQPPKVENRTSSTSSSNQPSWKTMRSEESQLGNSSKAHAKYSTSNSSKTSPSLRCRVESLCFREIQGSWLQLV
jgi:hypothetical protein